MAVHEILSIKQADVTKERLKYLLNRFLQNQATEEELKEYADWFEKTGTKGPDMLEDDDTIKEYTTSLYNRVINTIDENEKEKKRTRRIIIMRWAAAASLILVAGAFLLYNNRDTSSPASIAEAKTIQPDSLKSTKANFKNDQNKSRKNSLNDGSVVDLFPGSELACEFNKGQRTLYLKGKAFFDVAKDSSKPFTVYSGNISTTALGTSFMIDAYPKDDHVEVSLHTGKVVIRQIGQNGAKNMKDVYLLPGHSLTYNITTGSAKVKSFTKPAANENDNHWVYEGRTGYEATFNQTALADVLEALEKEYAVSIRYNKEELSDMYFSGHILRTDSLARVIKRIALLHNLRINATAKGYTIRKDH